MAIKWRNQDVEKLAKSVKAFNAKRARLIKKSPDLIEYLPDKMSVKALRKDITERNDFNKQINSLNRFMKKGVEKQVITAKGIKTTKYQLREVQLKIQQINLKRAYERKIADVSTTKGTMGTIRSHNLSPKIFNIDTIKKGDWRKYVENVEKQAMSDYNEKKLAQYKANYLKAIDNEYGIIGKEYKERIKKLTPRELYESSFKDPRLDIKFHYTIDEIKNRIEMQIDALNMLNL